MMTDTNISSTSEEVKNPITTDEIKLTLRPEIFQSPGRMEFAFDISSKTNDTRRSIPVIRNENIKKGALLFDVTLPPGTDKELAKAWDVMVQKGIFVEASIGCWIPDKQHWPQRGQRGLKVGSHLTAALFNGMPKPEEKETRNADGWPIQLQYSHLCHLNVCCNPAHIVLEPQWMNLKRNFCGHSSVEGSLNPCDCRMLPPCLVKYRPSSVPRTLSVLSYESSSVAKRVGKTCARLALKLHRIDKYKAADKISVNRQKRKKRSAKHEQQTKKKSRKKFAAVV